MQGTVQIRPAGKRVGAATQSDSSGSGRETTKPSYRLVIYDKGTNSKYLIDTGSDVSCIPLQKHGRKTTPEPFVLYAANNTQIKTFGTQLLSLDLGLRRNFRWKFIIAQVTTPIIGADFLRHYGLLVDLKGRKLVDSLTNLTAAGNAKLSDQVAIKVINDRSPFQALLKNFPDIITPTPNFKRVKHSTQHYIQTTGPPVFSKPRRISPKILGEVKKEFEFMIAQGICRPSMSCWASPCTSSLKHPVAFAW